MEQPSLFYESYEEALRDDVRACGGLKMVGKLFFPEKDTVGAGRALADKLNEARRERLTDEQERLVMRMAKERRGYSAAFHFICDDIGCERGRPLTPKDEAAELQRRGMDLVREMRSVADRYERVTQPPLQAITGGKT